MLLIHQMNDMMNQGIKEVHHQDYLSYYQVTIENIFKMVELMKYIVSFRARSIHSCQIVK
jgi:predicted phosphoadenosine phosphosulfate sulfurtransferase